MKYSCASAFSISLNKYLVIFGLLFIVVPARAGSDTTYGPIRLVPKDNDQNQSQGSEQHDRRACAPGDSAKDVGSACSGCFGDMFGDIFGDIFNYVLIKPFQSFFSTGDSIGNFSEKRLKWGLGGSFLDFSLYPNAAFTWGIQVNSCLVYAPNEIIAFREQLEAQVSLYGNYLSNFERTVYVDGSSVGDQTNVGTSYANYSFPLYTEILARTGAGSTFYFIVGAGPRYVYEKFEGVTSYSFPAPSDTVKITGGNWIPSFSFGIGKLVTAGAGFGTFEIKYSLGINGDRKQVPLPGDNTVFVHGLAALQYEILF